MSDEIRGSVGNEARAAAIGKDIQQISIYTDQLTWRETVRHEFDMVHRQIADLRGWVRGLLIAVIIIFFTGFILSLLALRQFDLQSFRMESNRQRIEMLEQRVIPPPVPFVPIP